MLAVLQAMTTMSGSGALDQCADHLDDALDQRRLVPGAIGKGGVVGGIEADVASGSSARTARATVSPPMPESNSRMRGAFIPRSFPSCANAPV